MNAKETFFSGYRSAVARIARHIDTGGEMSCSDLNVLAFVVGLQDEAIYAKTGASFVVGGARQIMEKEYAAFLEKNKE